MTRLTRQELYNKVWSIPMIKLSKKLGIPDPYSNLLSFDEMINYDIKSETVIDYSGRQLSDLSIISKTDSKRLNDALYQILHTMDKCGLVKQKGYNILIQLLALKIYDEKKNSSDLKYYINPNEQNYKNLSDDSIQDFLTRIEKIRKEAKTSYQKILNENYFDSQDESQVKLVIEIVKQFQNYSFTNSERNNLYQLADIPIPDFPSNKEALITKLYSNSNAVYNCSKYSLDNFLEYDNKFNKLAGIYEIDKSMKLLQERLNNAIDNIANDKEVEIMF